MNEDLGEKSSAVYEASSHQLIDQMYCEKEELTEEDIEAIQLAREENTYYNWLDKHEYDRCICF